MKIIVKKFLNKLYEYVPIIKKIMMIKISNDFEFETCDV